MALVVQYEDEKGFSMADSYWVIDTITLMPRRSQIVIQMAGFKTKAACRNGKQPIGYKQVTLGGPEAEAVFAEINDNRKYPLSYFYKLAQMYPVASMNPAEDKKFFVPATDDLDAGQKVETVSVPQSKEFDAPVLPIAEPQG